MRSIEDENLDLAFDSLKEYLKTISKYAYRRAQDTGELTYYSQEGFLIEELFGIYWDEIFRFLFFNGYYRLDKKIQNSKKIKIFIKDDSRNLFIENALAGSDDPFSETIRLFTGSSWLSVSVDLLGFSYGSIKDKMIEDGFF